MNTIPPLQNAILEQVARALGVQHAPVMYIPLAHHVYTLVSRVEMAIGETLDTSADTPLTVSSPDPLTESTPVGLTWWFKTKSYGFEIRADRDVDGFKAPELRGWGMPLLTMVLRTAP